MGGLKLLENKLAHFGEIRPHKNRRSSSCDLTKTLPQMTLEKTTRDACWKLLLATWPGIDDLPDGVFALIVNRIQRVLETEGLAAITPERIEG